MTLRKRADDLRRGDQFLFVAANGRTIATVQTIEEGTTERDLAPSQIARHIAESPLIGLGIALARPVAVPDAPGWKMHCLTLWAAPDERFELYL